MVILISKEDINNFNKVVMSIAGLFFSLTCSSQVDKINLNVGVKCYVPFTLGHYATTNVPFISYAAAIPTIGGEVMIDKNKSVEFRSSYFIIPYFRNWPANANLTISQKITDKSLFYNKYLNTSRFGVIKLSVGLSRHRFSSTIDYRFWSSTLAIGSKIKWVYAEFRYEPSLDFFLDKNLFSLNFIYQIPIKK